MEHTREWFMRNQESIMKKMPMHECCNCKGTNDLQLHHIVPLVLSGTNFSSNLCLVCEKCHSLIHDMNLLKNKELRQKEIEKAKLEGKYKGYQTKLITGGIEEEKMKNIIAEHLSGVKVREISEKYEVSRATVYRILKRERIKASRMAC